MIFMIVNETIPMLPEHAIEFGEASWDNNVTSVRRRKNNSSGGYDPFSSSEIPLDGGYLDLGDIVCICLGRDRIPQDQMRNMYKELQASASRQGITL